LNPKPKEDFRNSLEKDIQRYCSSGFPKYPVYVSSNCEPLQPLEDEYRHTLYALKKLTEKDFPILIMTKNPSKLLEPDYVKALNKSKTMIQVTIPFLNNRFEPNAPTPNERIRAVGSLTTLGFQVVARVDPVIPVYDGIEGQSVEEIDSLVYKLHGVGVNLVVSKCLRLVNGIKKMYPRLYDCLKPYYRINRSEESHCELNCESKQKLLTPIYEACNKYGMKMATCVDGRHVNFPASIRCDGLEDML
jgi:DNA repair photolyase